MKAPQIMANANSIRFAVLFLILAAVSGFAQTQQFNATAVNIDDPPYGLVAQLWCASGCVIDHIDATGILDPGQSGQPTFGFGFSFTEENHCKPTPVIVFDPVNGPQPISDPGTRASQQPCTPNGLPYSSSNYTPTNTAPAGFYQPPVLQQCWQLVCSIDFPGGLTIPPNHGVTVYTSLQPSYLGWKGYASVNFRGRK
jgi:hypothetical protein